ncbi:hypothetical protein [Sodalis sp. RH16]|uniref:hypothetical protein n=1 Tax=Sodalis sp. RH16 TaxID=3394331 RepID=UPI0039B38C9E
MLTADKTQSPALISVSNDSKEINARLPFLEEINSIKNISNSKIIANDTAVDLPFDNEATAGTGENTTSFDNSPSAGSAGSGGTRGFSWGVKIFSLLTAIFGGGKFIHYMRSGDGKPHGKKWFSELPPEEYMKAKKINAIVRNNSIGLPIYSTPRNMNISEALLRTLISIRLSPDIYGQASIFPTGMSHAGQAMGLEKNNDGYAFEDTPLDAHTLRKQPLGPEAAIEGGYWIMTKKATATKPLMRHSKRKKREVVQNFSKFNLPACVIDNHFREYWVDLLTNIEKYYDINQMLTKTAGNRERLQPSNLLPDGELSTDTSLDGYQKKSERNRWLHTFGISNEYLSANANLTINFIDIMLSDIIQRDYGLSLTSQDLDKLLTIDIVYTKKVGELEPHKYIAHGEYSLRKILLREPFKVLLKPNESEYTHLTILRTNIKESDKKDFISYLEFIVNGEPSNITAEIERLLTFFSTSEDINDTYITMAKDRLAIALFSLMTNDTDSTLRNIIELWMDGSIKEKLVGFVSPEGQFMVPGIVAITQPTGGLMISLATGAIYLWTPDDASAALKNFIAGHLSLQHKAWLESVILTPKIDMKACAIKPPLLLMDAKVLWADLKALEIEKLGEHLSYHPLFSTGPEKSVPAEQASQRLLASGNALSLLAFFFTGGTSAGCAAMMLSNVVTGTGSALYLYQAVNAQDRQKRKEAWKSAMLGIMIIGLSGTTDIYSLIKASGYHGYKLMHEAATQLRDVLTLSDSNSVAKAFVKGGARVRAIMLVEALIKENVGQLEILGQNSVGVMSKVLQICGRIDAHQSRLLSEKSFIAEIFSQIRSIHDKASLASIPAGYELILLDNETNKSSLMLLSLGNDRFAGFDIKSLTQPAIFSSHKGWQVVSSDDFIFDKNSVMLNDGSTATLYAEDLHGASLATLGDDMTRHESELATKLRRYCNRFKFDGNTINMFSGVERFAYNNGFYNIRYRALFIFDPVMESQTVRHYVLVATHAEVTYIIEPNAEKIRYINIPDIEDVMILTEDRWRKCFEKSRSRALITYKDFLTEQSARDYYHNFNIKESSEHILLSPAGFVELEESSAPVTFPLFLSYYEGMGQQLLLQKKIRNSIIKDRKSRSSYEFIMSLLKATGTISAGRKDDLVNFYHEHPQEALLEVIDSPKQIRTFRDMLCVEPGKLVRFTNLNDSSVFHLMISLGNGRFAGMNNDLLDSTLSSEKRILIAEQLGLFRDDVLCSFDKLNSFIIEKGDLPHSSPPRKCLMDIATETIHETISEKSSTHFALEFLVAAQQLVPQQADALERLVMLITGKLDGEKISIIKLNKFLIIDKYIDNNAELKNIAECKLVVFYTEDKHFHTMVSLGDNQFLGINNHIINNEINRNQMIISSQEMGEIIAGKRFNNQNVFKVIVGDVNLEKTRISALLGPDGRIEYVRYGLNDLQMEIKAHGALASINHYDAIELADIIAGIHRSMYPEQSLKRLELISCFGALGGRRSSAQIISDRLGAKVLSYKGIVTDSKSRNRGSGVMFEPHVGYGIERLREDERWHRRIHNFIENVLGLFGHLPFRRHGRAIGENIPFAMVVIDVLHFLRKEISAETLMRLYPGLMSEKSLSEAGLLANPVSQEEALIAALLTIFYGNSNITNAMDAYILAGEYQNQSSGSVVRYGENLLQPLYWEDIVPALATFRQLPAVIVENDLLGGSNIYISMKNDDDNLQEYMIRVGSKCNNRRLWPLLLANFFSEQPGSFPVMAGLKEQDILRMGFDFTHFHFYLNSWFRNDFSLQIDMPPPEISPESCRPADYVHFSGRGRKTDTREDIGLGHSLLLEQDGRLALQMKDTLSVERPAGLGDSGQPPANASPLLSMPRVVMTLVENDERLIMLQRNIPTEILSNNGEIAFFIAGEINKYTRSIKVGVKNSENILPTKSNVANSVYSDPVSLQKSWILVNLIHND